MIRRIGLVALGIVVALGVTGCSMLPLAADRGAGAQPSQAQQEQHEQQTEDAACAIVTSEWGRVLDRWTAIRDAHGPDTPIAQRKTEHEAVIEDLQDIADRVEVAGVRTALDTTIEVHQRYFDEMWQALMEVPPGYVVDLNDPSNLLVIFGKRSVEYQQEMADADLQRYELCGPVQSSQTTDQACAIVDEDWTNAAVAYSAAARTSGDDWDLAQEQLAAALRQFRVTMSQVAVPEILAELDGMYQLYEKDSAYDVTPEEIAAMDPDELNEYAAEAQAAAEEFDRALTAGEDAVIALCGGAG